MLKSDYSINNRNSHKTFSHQKKPVHAMTHNTTQQNDSNSNLKWNEKLVCLTFEISDCHNLGMNWVLYVLFCLWVFCVRFYHSVSCILLCFSVSYVSPQVSSKWYQFRISLTTRFYKLNRESVRTHTMLHGKMAKLSALNFKVTYFLLWWNIKWIIFYGRSQRKVQNISFSLVDFLSFLFN